MPPTRRVGGKACLSRVLTNILSVPEYETESPCTGNLGYNCDMTKKHFIALAVITRSISNEQTRTYVAHQQADYFATVNPNFDSARYLSACGV